MRPVSLLCALLVWLGLALTAIAEPISVLWLDSGPVESGRNETHRRQMTTYLEALDGGQRFRVTYVTQRGGEAASALATGRFDLIVADAGNPTRRYNTADLEAIKSFYAEGHRVVMLDGSLGIRSATYTPETRFPGVNGSSAALLVNQLLSIHEAGGGILIGSDHDRFQADSNQLARALIPGAGFSGITNPSTNGDFIGKDLLAKHTPIIPMDLFRHWASVPNQGEAAVGTFTDFTGQMVELHALIEAADKPGSGRKRPYISATFNPGTERFALDSEEAIADSMPTRVGPSRAENQARARGD